MSISPSQKFRDYSASFFETTEDGAGSMKQRCDQVSQANLNTGRLYDKCIIMKEHNLPFHDVGRTLKN